MKKIYLGEQKPEICYEAYKKVVLIGDYLDIEHDNIYYIKYSESMMYKHFYKLLQEIDKNTIVICNNILKKNRYSLEYNCIRRYCLQAGSVVVYSYFPFLSKKEEFMGLYDMIQENPFWKESYKYIDKFENVSVSEIEFEINEKFIKLDPKIHKKYQEEKEKQIKNVKKDADIIPRRLLKFADKHRGESDKLNEIKKKLNVTVTDLKVDEYYLNLLYEYRKELNEFKKDIQERC